jgi:ADP-heptose:LPS heptosyltransferase
VAVTLVLRALGLGDLLTAVPALRALRRARPTDRIVLAAPEPLAPLLPLLDAVDELLPTPGLGALRPPQGPAPALAVNLHGRGPESIADLLTTRPYRLISHRHPSYPDIAGPAWRREVHEVDRWCALLERHGIDADRTELALRAPEVPTPAPGAVVVHPGAAFPARRWPPERFAAVAAGLAAAGHHVVVTGNAAEAPLAAAVAARGGLPEGSTLTGHALDVLAALVAGAALVVCGDTGVGHLATAFGTPSVLLFGPTPPSAWGPPPGRPQHVALWAGRTGDPHGRHPDPGLLKLTPAPVLVAAERLLPEATHA